MASNESKLDGEVYSEQLSDSQVQGSDHSAPEAACPDQTEGDMDYLAQTIYPYGQPPTIGVSPYAMHTMLSALPSFQAPQHYNQHFNQAHYIQQHGVNNGGPGHHVFLPAMQQQNSDQYLSPTHQQFQPQLLRPSQTYGTNQYPSLPSSEAIYSFNQQQQYLYGTSMSAMVQPGHYNPGQHRFFQQRRVESARIYRASGNMSSTHPNLTTSSLSDSKGSTSPSQSGSTLRGPPRKPRQSGHALWVGNLPPGTQINALKDHFSTEATKEIESVFLISKSNCAFVNYKTEEACMAAMSRFHDSIFGGARLVCRHRRGTDGNSPNSDQASTIAGELYTQSSVAQSQEISVRSDTQHRDIQHSTSEEHLDPERVQEKFFIIKSLTVDDLERSVISELWATQTHNEDILNRAFKSADNVYLIFSANKSGEYFGYARMESLITAATSELTTSSKVAESNDAAVLLPAGAHRSTDLPITIKTPASVTAPEGRIIDDSGRGTIFWEAYTDENSQESDEMADSVAMKGKANFEASSSQASPAPQAAFFGKSFAIRWISTERLPFYRTRGLRNPWNSNREVKIARDGTELEPGVGRRLISMFQQSNLANRVHDLPGQYIQHPSPLHHPSVYRLG